MKKLFFNIKHSGLLLILYIFINNILIAEPMIILEYSDSKSSQIDTNIKKNSFTKDENYSVTHKINKNDTLSAIMDNYYGNSNLNLRFIQSAIVHKNKKAFVRANPNFMFAGKNLYLPSINEIKNLVYKNHKIKDELADDDIKNLDIYFFGN
tara:strand:+ start:39 stop:494 length:456 start_codon:yes stop_codon:yes gene_type:complete